MKKVAGFDGSSIRGFQAINESDMLLFPDPATAIIDPVCKIPTLSITCNIKDPITLENYTRDVRHIAQKAESYLQSTGIGDISYWGPEAEFYLLNDIRYGQNQHSGFYSVDSVEGVGILVVKRTRTWVTNRVTKRVTSRSRLRIRSRIYAPRSV